MKQQHLELVGMLVTKATTVNKYHIDYLYRIDFGGSLVGSVIQKGFDWPLHAPFWDIVLDLSNAYAPAIDKRWVKYRREAVEVFMSFRHGQTPNGEGLGGGWTLECER